MNLSLARRLKTVLGFGLAGVLTACGANATARQHGSAVTSLSIPTSALTAANLPFWTALYSGQFGKEGLRVKTSILKGDTQVVQGLASGTYSVAVAGAPAVFSADAKGAQIVILAPQTATPLFQLFVAPEIHSFNDLRGKAIGVPVLGGAIYALTLYTLHAHGLKVGNASGDVHLVETGGTPQVLTAMIAHQTVAGIVSPPTSLKAAAAGFSELQNFIGSDVPLYQTAFDASKAWVSAHPALTKKLLVAYDAGFKLVESDKSLAEKALAEYAKITSKSILQATYQEAVKALPAKPTVSTTALRFMAENLDPGLPSTFNVAEVLPPS